MSGLEIMAKHKDVLCIPGVFVLMVTVMEKRGRHSVDSEDSVAGSKVVGDQVD